MNKYTFYVNLYIILIINKNLDAVSALIILEDYSNHKFTLSEHVDVKTWLK